jgi:FkbM family methyltransferase
MNLGNLIKTAARAFGVELTRYRAPALTSPLPWDAEIWRWPALNALALAVSHALLKHIRERRDLSEFTVIQVGAFDGSTFDPVRNCILQYGLKAVLVEPQPDVFERLVTSYKGQANVTFENAAISKCEGIATLYRFRQFESTPSIAGALASLDRQMLLDNHHNMSGEIEEVQVKLTTLETLMRKHKIDIVSLLQIDAEGHDWSILQTVDFNKYRPLIIHYEISVLPPPDQRASIEYLSSNGYGILWYGTADLLAYRRDQIDAPINADWHA